MKNLVNLTVHISEKWSKEQLEAAGDVYDMGGILIPSNASYDEVLEIAQKKVEDILDLNLEKENTRVLLGGELSVMIAIYEKLKEIGYQTVVATTERISKEFVNERGETVKTNVFKFVQFREI